MKSWKQHDRTVFYDEISVPVHKLPQKLRPPLTDISDAELGKINTAGAKNELARREQLRKEHVEAGRVRYVFRTEGYQGSPIWWMHRLPTRTVSGDKGYPEGRPCETPSQGIAMAVMTLRYHDEGGVIYANTYDGETQVIDVRPTSCEAVEKTGKHDWSYDTMGGDVCRSCGLVT